MMRARTRGRPDGLQRSTGRFGIHQAIVVRHDVARAPLRVALRLPWLPAGMTSWARLAVPMAGPGRGAYLLPEVGSQVVVVFEHGDVARPIVLGSLWSQEEPPMVDARAGDHIVRSRAGLEVALGGEAGGERVTLRDASGQNQVVLERTGRIAVGAARRLEVVAPSGAVRVVADRVRVVARSRLVARTAGAVLVDGEASVELTAGVSVGLMGPRIELNEAQPSTLRRR